MQRSATFLLFSLLMLTTVSAQADIIDDAIGNIQQAINDAYKRTTGGIMMIPVMKAGSAR